MEMLEEHQRRVNAVAEQIKKIAASPGSKRINIVHGSTNSTRTESNNDFTSVDISNFGHILKVDEKNKFVYTEPNVSLDQLLRETLKHGFIPQVIAEFPGITVGGAVNGASAESSSFMYGQFNDTAEEYEVILGNGDVQRISRALSPDLFYGISGSYGTLALLTAIKLRLMPSKQYVHLTYEPVKSFQEACDMLLERSRDGGIQYIDGLMFEKNRGVVITGRLSDEMNVPVRTFSHAHDPWYYQEAENVSGHGTIFEELVPITDYLFRYNRGAFWMGEYALSLLHFPHNRLMRFILNPWMSTRKLYEAMHATNLSQEYFIQDFCIPSKSVVEFLNRSEEKLGIYPLWLLPMKTTRDPQKLSPHYIDDDILIDVGIWGQSEKYLADPIGLNTQFESLVAGLGGRKVLYAHTYYSKDDFWRIYDHSWYAALREKYHATEALPEIWEKVHVIPHPFDHHMVQGAIKLLIGSFEKGFK